jgi:hypothetical protein
VGEGDGARAAEPACETVQSGEAGPCQWTHADGAAVPDTRVRGRDWLILYIHFVASPDREQTMKQICYSMEDQRPHMHSKHADMSLQNNTHARKAKKKKAEQKGIIGAVRMYKTTKKKKKNKKEKKESKQERKKTTRVRRIRSP